MFCVWCVCCVCCVLLRDACCVMSSYESNCNEENNGSRLWLEKRREERSRDVKKDTKAAGPPVEGIRWM